jgi:hypothetical protein
MTVTITEEAIDIDGGQVRYYPYYIDQHWNEQAEDRLVVMRKIVAQWADELARAKDGQKLYLPYSLDDQEVECFEAQLQGNEITLRCVEIHWNGYSMVLDEIGDFITYSPHEFWNERPELFGKYSKHHLIQALRNAEISDDRSS